MALPDCVSNQEHAAAGWAISFPWRDEQRAEQLLAGIEGGERHQRRVNQIMALQNGVEVEDQVDPGLC